jgi:hypothetical protein
MSIFNNPKGLITDWDGDSVGDKAKGLEQLGYLSGIVSYLGISIGGFPLLNLAVMLSFLFDVVKKLKYFNTNYGRYMKHLLKILSNDQDLSKTQKMFFEDGWTKYTTTNSRPLINPGVY